METKPTELMLEVHKLRIGMFVHLDLGWMDHPFPLNRFKISTNSQIEQIKGLRLKQVKVMTALSDPTALSDEDAVVPVQEAPLSAEALAQQQAAEAVAARRQLLAQQNADLTRCEREFSSATGAWKQVATLVQRDVKQALQESETLVKGLIDQLTSTRESNIRLLSETAGDGNALHALNVTVISLLLGRSLQLDDATLSDIGLGALLHDIGKLALPDRLRWHSDKFTAVEEKTYREHVLAGLKMGEKMGLSPGTMTVLAQHHETADGKGYPAGINKDSMSQAARVVALVNAYDNLCNPGNVALAATPHEALAMMFAQIKPRFDSACLTAFIRMMGVYPPGSVVQLSDERFALVVSVNASRPLRPKVIVHDMKVPAEEALIVDLQTEPALGIRRSLHPRHLSRPVLEYLSPRKRMCYFFERTTETNSVVWIDSGQGQGSGGGE